VNHIWAVPGVQTESKRVPKPVLQALVLADNVYQDKFTGKKVIAGTFNQLGFFESKAASPTPEESPGKLRPLAPHEVRRVGSPTAYISLTEIREPVELELRYVDLSNNAVLLAANLRAACDNPLNTVEAIVPLPPLPTPHAGGYALELLWDNELLGSLRITAVESPETPEGK
jgi:hypothetical protein